jgi:hypothetical protein
MSQTPPAGWVFNDCFWRQQTDLSGVVKLTSPTTQLISGNVALAKGSKLLGVKSDGAQGNLVSVGDYPDGSGGTYEQVEVGTESDPLCLNHNAKSADGTVVGKHIIVNYKDAAGANQADAVAYVSDLPVNNSRTAFVDAVFGNDATGELDNAAKPFLTAQAAYTAAGESEHALYVDASYVNAVFDFADRCYLINYNQLHMAGPAKNQFRLVTGSFNDRFCRGAAFLFTYAKPAGSAVVTLTNYDYPANTTQTVDFTGLAARDLAGATLLSAGIDRLAFWDGGATLFNLKYSGPGTLDTAAAADLNNLANWAVGAVVAAPQTATGSSLSFVGNVSNGAAFHGGQTVYASLADPGANDHWNIYVEGYVGYSCGGNVAVERRDFYDYFWGVADNEQDAAARYYGTVQVQIFNNGGLLGGVIDYYLSGSGMGGYEQWTPCAAGDALFLRQYSNNSGYAPEFVYNGGWRDYYYPVVTMEDGNTLTLPDEYCVCDLGAAGNPQLQFRAEYGRFEKTIDGWATKGENGQVLVRLGVGSFTVDGNNGTYFTRIKFAGAGYAASNLTLQNFNSVDIVGDDSARYYFDVNSLSADSIQGEVSAQTKLGMIDNCWLTAAAPITTNMNSEISNSRIDGNLVADSFSILRDCEINGEVALLANSKYYFSMYQCRVTGNVLNCSLLVGGQIGSYTKNNAYEGYLLGCAIYGSVNVTLPATGGSGTITINNSACMSKIRITNNSTASGFGVAVKNTSSATLAIDGNGTAGVITLLNCAANSASLNLAATLPAPVKLAGCNFTGNVSINGATGNFKLTSCALANYTTLAGQGKGVFQNCYDI